MQKSNRLGRAAIVVAIAALAVIGFVVAGPSAFSATNSNATVSLRHTALGRVLVSSNGHTLYLFMKDKNGKSSCTAACAKYWPPMISAVKPTAGPGVKASLLGRTRRSNGKMQVTYNHHPLYWFALDAHAGQTTGEGNSAFGAKWFAVSAAGHAVVKAPPASTTTNSTTTSGGYSY